MVSHGFLIQIIITEQLNGLVLSVYICMKIKARQKKILYRSQKEVSIALEFISQNNLFLKPDTFLANKA